MKTIPADTSMYDALLLNISGSTVRTAISFYGKKHSFDDVFAA